MVHGAARNRMMATVSRPVHAPRRPVPFHPGTAIVCGLVAIGLLIALPALAGLVVAARWDRRQELQAVFWAYQNRVVAVPGA